MPTNEGTLTERVQNSLQKLSSVALELNAVSDELGKCVADVDAALKKLNLGIVAWARIQTWGGDEGSYTREEIGYCKVDGKWGVALRTVDGSQYDPEESVETWLFNDAPRSMRLSAIGKIEELLEKLSAQAVVTTQEVKGKLALAKEVALAVKSSSDAHETPKRALTPVASGSGVKK